MAEPSTTVAVAGAGLTSAAVLFFGPLLGEYIIILGAGALGTLVALADLLQEEDKISIGRIVGFIFRGIALSFAFAGILTMAAVYFLPPDFGITPYAITGTVAFAIGWTSNRWKDLKEKAADIITTVFTTIFSQRNSNKNNDNNGG